MTLFHWKVVEMIHYQLPLFPLRTVLFPGQTLPLHIFEPRYRQMIADCLETDRTFGVVLIREGQEVGGSAEPYDVGTTALIQDVERLDDGRMNIVTVGHERFRIEDYDSEDKPYLLGRVAPWPWHDESVAEPGLNQVVQRRLDRYVELFAKAAETDIRLEITAQHPATLAVLAAVVIQVSPEQKQALLEIPSVNELLRHLDQLLRQENQALQIMLASSHPPTKTGHPFSQN